MQNDKVLYYLINPVKAILDNLTNGIENNEQVFGEIIGIIDEKYGDE